MNTAPSVILRSAASARPTNRFRVGASELSVAVTGAGLLPTAATIACCCACSCSCSGGGGKGK